MDAAGSWRFLGGPDSWTYRLLDAQRKRLNRRLVRYLASYISAGKGSHVLEGGSGPGFASSLFAGEPGVGLSVALDKDLAALREGRRRDPGLPAVRADVYRLPFRSGTFDLVWNSSTLEHLEASREALAEMRRVTKEGGWVFIGVPYRCGPLGFQPWIKRTAFGAWIGPVFDRATLIRMVSEHGLIPLTVTTYFFHCFIGIVARKSAERLQPEAAQRDTESPCALAPAR